MATDSPMMPPDYGFYVGPSLVNWTYAEHPDVPGPVYDVAFVYMMLVGAFGVTSNAAIIAAFRKSKALWTSSNMVLVNLCVADLLIASFGIPIDMTAAFMHGWRLGRPLCTLTGFVLTLAGMAAIYTLTALSFQRWIIVTGRNVVDIEGFGVTVVILCLVWGSALAMALPPLLGWAAFVPESAGISCSSSWESSATFGYNLYFLALGFYLPLAVILLTSFAVVLQMKKNASQMLFLRTKKSARKRENKVNLMVFIMIASFLICWGPYAFISNYQLFGGYISPLATVFPVLFCKASVCLNPVIYVLMNSQYRDALTPEWMAKKKSPTALNAGLARPHHQHHTSSSARILLSAQSGKKKKTQQASVKSAKSVKGKDVDNSGETKKASSSGEVIHMMTIRGERGDGSD